MRGSNLRETLAELGLLEVWDEIKNKNGGLPRHRTGPRQQQDSGLTDGPCGTATDRPTSKTGRSASSEIRNPSCHEPPPGGRDSNTAHSPRPKTTEEEGGKQKDTKTGVVGRYLDKGGIPPTLTPDRETR